MLNFKFTKTAAADLKGMREWYSVLNPRIAERVFDDLRQGIKRLRRNPASGQTIEAPVRRTSIRLFPISVYYAVENDTLIVLRIVHRQNQSPPG